MTKEEYVKAFIDQQEKIYEEMVKLNDMYYEIYKGNVGEDWWNETSDNNAYPFEESFEEMLSKFQEWIWATKEKNWVK